MEATENLFKKQFASLDSHDIVLSYCQNVIVPKYEDVLSCTFINPSEIEGIDVEYFFRVKKEVSSDELLDLTLKVNNDFCDFCKKNNISLNFERIYVFFFFFSVCISLLNHGFYKKYAFKSFECLSNTLTTSSLRVLKTRFTPISLILDKYLANISMLSSSK